MCTLSALTPSLPWRLEGKKFQPKFHGDFSLCPTGSTRVKINGRHLIHLARVIGSPKRIQLMRALVILHMLVQLPMDTHIFLVTLALLGERPGSICNLSGAKETIRPRRKGHVALQIWKQPSSPETRATWDVCQL